MSQPISQNNTYIHKLHGTPSIHHSQRDVECHVIPTAGLFGTVILQAQSGQIKTSFHLLFVDKCGKIKSAYVDVPSHNEINFTTAKTVRELDPIFQQSIASAEWHVM